MEADPELVVDANVVLPGAVAFQAFEAIPRRHAELAEISHPIELCQLASDRRPEDRRTGVVRLAAVQAIEEILGGGIRERAYHA
jgi:hypothetical protein